MARYDFICTECNNEEVIYMKMSEIGNKEVKCSKCGGVSKQNFSNKSSVPIKFKGPGFYTNDYKTQKLGNGIELRHK